MHLSGCPLVVPNWYFTGPGTDILGAQCHLRPPKVCGGLVFFSYSQAKYMIMPVRCSRCRTTTLQNHMRNLHWVPITVLHGGNPQDQLASLHVMDHSKGQQVDAQLHQKRVRKHCLTCTYHLRLRNVCRVSLV